MKKLSEVVDLKNLELTDEDVCEMCGSEENVTYLDIDLFICVNCLSKWQINMAVELEKTVKEACAGKGKFILLQDEKGDALIEFGCNQFDCSVFGKLSSDIDDDVSDWSLKNFISRELLF